MLTISERQEMWELQKILANLADGRPLTIIPGYCADSQLMFRYFALRANMSIPADGLRTVWTFPDEDIYVNSK